MPREDLFLYTLQHARNGDLQRELSEYLTEAKDAARETGKPVKVALVLTVTAKGRQFFITDEAKVALPKRIQDTTIMFEDDAGNFTRRDPNQPELELRSVDDKPAELKEAL